MTGTDLFTLIKKAKVYFEYYASKREDFPQGGWVTFNLNDLAAFIDEYFLPRPLYGDETPVKVGDIFLPYREGEELMPHIPQKVTVFYVIDNGSFSINGFQYNKYQRVMKPEEKPDSWEQIEADEKKDITEYWGCEDKDDKHCFECEHGLMKTRNSCRTNKYIDLFRRAKELAKGDSE